MDLCHTALDLKRKASRVGLKLNTGKTKVLSLVVTALFLFPLMGKVSKMFTVCISRSVIVANRVKWGIGVVDALYSIKGHHK